MTGLQTLKIRGFKCFQDASIELDDFTVLVGLNGSGKSAFIDVLKFLVEFAHEGAEVPLLRRGGFSSVVYDRASYISFELNSCYRIEITPDGISEVLIGEEKKVVRLKNRWYSGVWGDTHLLSENEQSIKKFPYTIGFFDIQPYFIKKMSVLEGNSLKEDGSNLSHVLSGILADSDKKREFLLLVRDFLPYVEDVKVEYSPVSTAYSFVIKDKLAGKDIPLGSVSDGTVMVIALVVALYFSPYEILVFDEPTRYIHPSLIPRLIDHLQSISHEKQVIMTTHVPSVLTYVNIDNVRLFSRDADGSKIYKVSDLDYIKVFLEGGLTLADLFADGVLI